MNDDKNSGTSQYNRDHSKPGNGKNNGNKRYHRRVRSRSRTINDIYQNKHIEMKENDFIDIDDFECELFSDSDDYDYIDDDDEFYDDDEDPDYQDNDEYDDDEYAEEYDDVFMDENILSDYDNLYGTNHGSNRNIGRSSGQNKFDTEYSLINTNEKRLNSEQRLVYNLLRRVLLPPK